MSFLRDPIWITVVVSILSVIIPLITSIIIYRKQKHRKSVSYQVISNVSLLNTRNQFQGVVQILVKGISLNDANVVVIKIANTGNVPILPTDYINPIKFNFGKNTTVLDTEVVETIPSTINASVTRNSESVILEPVLLNSKDSIKIKVLLTGFTGECGVDARIVDINQIRGSNKIKSWSVRIAYSTILVSCTIAAVIALIAALDLGTIALFVVIAAILPLLIGIILILILFLSNRKD